MEELVLFSNLPDFISLVENVLLIYIPGWILLTIFFHKLSQSLSSVVKGILSIIISIILIRVTQGIGLAVVDAQPALKSVVDTKLFLIIGSLILSILTGYILFFFYRENSWLNRILNRALQGEDVQEDTFSKGDELIITSLGGSRQIGIFLGYFHEDTLDGMILNQNGLTRIIPKASIVSITVSKRKNKSHSGIKSKKAEQ